MVGEGSEGLGFAAGAVGGRRVGVDYLEGEAAFLRGDGGGGRGAVVNG